MRCQKQTCNNRGRNTERPVGESNCSCWRGVFWERLRSLFIHNATLMVPEKPGMEGSRSSGLLCCPLNSGDSGWCDFS